MATVKMISAVEVNAAINQGVQFDTAVYGTASPPIVRLGRDVVDGGVYVSAGTQTAVTLPIILDTFNAQGGATIIVKRGTNVGTSVITVVSGSAAGATVSVLGSGVADEVVGVFDGFAGVWR